VGRVLEAMDVTPHAPDVIYDAHDRESRASCLTVNYEMDN